MMKSKQSNNVSKAKSKKLILQPSVPSPEFYDSSCQNVSQRFKRLFHWGPIIALCIIFYIAVISSNAIFQWWPPLSTIGGLVHFLIYLLEFYLVMSNYIGACFVGPGFVPYFWQPANKLDAQFLQYCNFCEGFKPPRTHHCRKCDRCVLKMDHHCPWINTCCGHMNHGFFCYFLLSAPIGCLHSTVILICSLYKALYVSYYAMIEDVDIVYFTITEVLLTIFGIGLAIGVVLAVGGLFIFQFKGILKNETGIESWIKEKAEYRDREAGESEEFVYPYHLGKINNLRQVFTWSGNSVGDGVQWPLRSGCSQFDLTIEQLKQKRQKNLHAVTYRVIRPYSGRLLPCLSFGCRVSTSIPCTDEPRLIVNAGHLVKVTRWRTHWLYGQIVDNEPSAFVKGEKRIRRRGWFPRKCVSETSKPNMLDGDSHKTD